MAMKIPFTNKLNAVFLIYVIIAGKEVKTQDLAEANEVTGAGQDEVMVISLQKGGVPSNTSFAKLLTPFPEVRDFTICYRIRLNRFREESTLMSYAISEKEDNELRMDHRMTGYKVALHSKWANSDIITPLRYWEHFCFRFTYMTGEWKIFMNGELHATGAFPIVSIPLKGNGTYIIGQEQDELGGGFQRDQSYSGEITQINVWSTVLDEQTIKKIAKCQIPEVGDALAWKDQSWQINGDVTWVTYSQEEICDLETRRIVVFPNRYALDPAMHLCHNLGGIIAVPQTVEENQWMFNSSISRAQYCSGNVGASYLWLGAHDREEEGIWKYLEESKKIPWQGKWRGDGPNGGTVENCMVMLFGSFPGHWSDIACLDTYEFCVPCEFPKLESLYLKGPAVCPGSPFNLQYLLGEEKGGRPSLMGFFHSDIYWDDDEKVWVLQSKKENATAWWKPTDEGMYPFGTHSWTMENEICGTKAGKEVNLTISVCGSGEFTCQDGKCIALEKRCNLRVDCEDQSDEAVCSLVDIPRGYMNTIPPPPTTEKEPLPVIFTINIISFPSVATEDLTFVTSLLLKLRWQDTRLTYLNLKDDRSLNVLSQSTISRIWKPRVFFSNAQGNVFTNLDEGSRIECVRQGDSVIGPPHFPEEVNTFSGYENSLEMSQLYSVSYTCDFDLNMFPFDAQVCHLRFTLVSATVSYMKLVQGNATYTGPPNLIEYSIGHVTTRLVNMGEFSSIDVEVRFRRRYGFYMLTLYIPTTLIIITAYTTFFFNPFDFNSRIVVALTSLLVLSSLYTQTSNSLPKTSYFKLVDIWLFFAIVMIFIVVLLQTLIDFSAQAQMFHNGCWMSELMKKVFGRKSKRVNIKLDIHNERDGLCTSNFFKCYNPDDVPSDGIRINVQGYRRRPSSGNALVGWNEKNTVSPRALNQPDFVHLQGAKSQDKTVGHVNMSMMNKSRILIPTIFFIFNAAYWGTAVKYLNSLDKDGESIHQA